MKYSEKEIVDYLINIAKEQNLFDKASIYLKKLLLEDKRIDIQEHIDNYLERENISHIDRDTFINEHIFIEKRFHKLVFNHYLFDCKNYPLIATQISIYSSTIKKLSFWIGSITILTSFKNPNIFKYDLKIEKKQSRFVTYTNYHVYEESFYNPKVDSLTSFEKDIIDTFLEISKKYSLIEDIFKDFKDFLESEDYDTEILVKENLKKEDLLISFHSESATFLRAYNSEFPLVLETILKINLPNKNNYVEYFLYETFLDGKFWDSWGSYDNILE